MTIIIDFVKEWGGLILGALGTIGSVYVHLASDKKLKEQEKQINELQLATLKEERQSKKKAIINVKCQKLSSGSYTLLVANAGNVIANNVKIKILTPIFGITPGNDTKNYKSIVPQDVRKDIILHKVTTDPDEFDIVVSWDDEYMIGNQEQRTIGYN